MITRAIFVLSSPEAAHQFLRILPDLRALGLSEATLLHLVAAKRGPAEPMPELANWVRHFEAAIPKVELALKRGDPVKWIYELARVRNVHIVVLSGIPNGVRWHLERVTSPLRTLGIPILFLPAQQRPGLLGERVLIAIKSPESFDDAVHGLAEWFGADQLRAVRVGPKVSGRCGRECEGVKLEALTPKGDVATTLLNEARSYDATLLAILAEEDEASESSSAGTPVVKPIIERACWPVLVWPAAPARPYGS